MSKKKPRKGKPIHRPASASKLTSTDVDLDIPLCSTPSNGRAKLADERVEHHLLQAMNALNEAAQHYRSEKHINGLTIVSAVLQTVIDTSAPQDALRDLAIMATPLLTKIAPEGVIPVSVHDVAAAKAVLLRAIRRELARCRSFPPRAEDGRLNWDKISRTADSDDVDASQTVKQDATNLSAAIIGLLFFDQRLLRLHSARANSAEFSHQVERFTRVVIELVNNEQATWLQVGRPSYSPPRHTACTRRTRKPTREITTRTSWKHCAFCATTPTAFPRSKRACTTTAWPCNARHRATKA